MTKLKVKGGVMAPYYQALIQVDADADADYVLIFDKGLKKFTTKVKITGEVGITKVIVPYEYTLKTDLVVAITDSDEVFAIKAIDGITAEIIDGTITNILI
jgi:hypothetical protein